MRRTNSISWGVLVGIVGFFFAAITLPSVSRTMTRNDIISAVFVLTAFSVVPGVLTTVLAFILSRGPIATRDSPVCRRCGYDLRATPGRCPECGIVAEAKEA